MSNIRVDRKTGYITLDKELRDTLDLTTLYENGQNAYLSLAVDKENGDVFLHQITRDDYENKAYKNNVVRLGKTGKAKCLNLVRTMSHLFTPLSAVYTANVGKPIEMDGHTVFKLSNIKDDASTPRYIEDETTKKSLYHKWAALNEEVELDAGAIQEIMDRGAAELDEEVARLRNLVIDGEPVFGNEPVRGVRGARPAAPDEVFIPVGEGREIIVEEQHDADFQEDGEDERPF